MIIKLRKKNQLKQKKKLNNKLVLKNHKIKYLTKRIINIKNRKKIKKIKKLLKNFLLMKKIIF